MIVKCSRLFASIKKANSFIAGLALASWLAMAQANSSTNSSPLGSPDANSLRYQQGKQVYNYRCYYCHAYSGDAKTVAARFVSPKPLNFRQSNPLDYDSSKMKIAIHEGRAGTAMPAFKNTLDATAIESVIYYIQQGFMLGKEPAGGYHTKDNGWPNHKLKYAAAYSYILGTDKIDQVAVTLSEQQQSGKVLFLNSCITCHEPWTENENIEIWQPVAVSYPRSHSPFREPDFISGATVFSKHDVNQEVLEGKLAKGRELYLDNCAFCHSPDKTGKNWIGRFLQPNPRDLSDKQFLARENVKSLSAKIALGVPNTSMPRWDAVLTKEEINMIATFLLNSVETPDNKVTEMGDSHSNPQLISKDTTSQSR